MPRSAALSRGSQPPLSCVVASTPGTGSSLLCRGLAQTGIVGQPDEYIGHSLYRSLARQWGYGPKDQPATTRVERAMLHTATPNGVFALRAHWYDFALLLRTIRNTAGCDDLLGHVDRLLVSPRYIHISRRDTAAQALSYYRAIFTGDAGVRSDAPPDPGRDGPEPVILEQVRWLEDLLIDWDAQWRAYFARCDIRPLEVAYEDFASNYGPTIEGVLEHLGLGSIPGAVDLDAPDRTPPSEWTQHWLDEYRAGRDRLASQPAEESWSREDRFFEVTHSTEPTGPVGTGGAVPSSPFEDEVLYSCVVDKPPRITYQSLIWVLTLTRLAGLAPEQLVVHAVEGTDPDHLVLLQSLGVRVVPVARFDERNVYANKLRQLTTGALADASTAVLSDCDLAFAGDIAPFIRGDVIRARAVGAGLPTMQGWRRLISIAGLTRELRLARSAQTLVWTCVQNLNGGLLVIPRRFHDQLAEAWPRWFGWVLDHGDELAADVNRFAGQVSFGLALIELGLPVGWMPVNTNFPYKAADENFPYKAAEATPAGTTFPLVIHYHKHLTGDGRLKEVGVPAVDEYVAKVNELLDRPASRDILEVALRNWQASLDPPPSSRLSKLKSRWSTASR
jgi:trehalose 2-sulfotransferase